MSALTIRLPDDKYQRLKELSRQRGTLETRFAVRAARGHGQQEQGLALLRKAAGQE